MFPTGCPTAGTAHAGSTCSAAESLACTLDMESVTRSCTSVMALLRLFMFPVMPSAMPGAIQRPTSSRITRDGLSILNALVNPSMIPETKPLIWPSSQSFARRIPFHRPSTACLPISSSFPGNSRIPVTTLFNSVFAASRPFCPSSSAQFVTLYKAVKSQVRIRPGSWEKKLPTFVRNVLPAWTARPGSCITQLASVPSAWPRKLPIR